MELDADAALVSTCMVTVVEAPDVIHAQDSEDVVKANASFHIGFVAHGLAKGIGREQENIIGHRRIVLVAEATPDATQSEHLAQAQLLNQRQTVHQHAIPPIGQVP